MSPSTIRTVAPNARIRSSLSGLALAPATTVTEIPRLRPLQASASPRLPALAQTADLEPGFSASRAMTVSAPRALKHRTGLAVSSLRMSSQSSASPRAGHAYWGVLRKTGAIFGIAERILFKSNRVCGSAR